MDLIGWSHVGVAKKSRLWWHVSLGGAWWWWRCPRAGACLAHWQLWGDQMVPRIIRGHVGNNKTKETLDLELCRLGRRVKSSVVFCQLVDTSRVIIPLHLFSCWRRMFFFFPPLFNTSAARVTTHAFYGPCVIQKHERTHELHTFHPVWSY